MKTMRSTYIALFGVLLLIAGSFTVCAQEAQQPAAQGDAQKAGYRAAAKE